MSDKPADPRASRFDRAAAALNLSSDDRGKTLIKLAELAFSPDSASGTELAIAMHVERLVERLPKDIEAAAERATGNVADTAAKIEKASAATMAAHQAELVSSVGAKIAESADHALSRRVAVLARNTLGVWLATALVMSAGMAAVGYHFGQANITDTEIELSAMLQREDGESWKALMAVNNLRASLAAYCKPGSQRIRSAAGGTYCDLPLWLARDGVVSPVPHQPAEGNAILAAAGNWLARWGPWWLLAAGAVGVLLIRKVIAAAVSLRLVRWLFDLPPLPRHLEAVE